MRIHEIFDIKNAKSKGYETYEKGHTPFVSNGTYNNGVLGFVKPNKGDRVFLKSGICVSSFCEATVHNPPFLPRGNGGSGLIVLLPKAPLSLESLYYYAAQINTHKWRFSFGRMVTSERIKNLELEENKINISINKEINRLLPQTKIKARPKINSLFKKVRLVDYCTIEKKTAKPINQMLSGPTPYVSTTSKNNGILDYVADPPIFSPKCITVALNGSVGEAFYQFDDFITSGDNAVLRPKGFTDPYLLFYIAYEIRRQKWRYNYYRKLTLAKLRKMEIYLPFKESGLLDFNFIKSVFQNSYGYEIISKHFDK